MANPIAEMHAGQPSRLTEIFKHFDKSNILIPLPSDLVGSSFAISLEDF